MPSDADAPPTGASVVFVTSGEYTGSLTAAAGQSDPIVAADRLCQLAADGAGLQGTFRAWLSVPGDDAIDRIQDAGPWYNLRGDRVFLNGASLASTAQAELSYNEFGAAQLGNAWTGTETGGRASAFGCRGWTSASTGENGTVGNVEDRTNWTDSFDPGCNNRHSLYCFQQER